MNVVNSMLNKLEERGAVGDLAATDVRVVSPHVSTHGRGMMRWLLMVFVLLACAVLVWWGLRDDQQAALVPTLNGVSSPLHVATNDMQLKAGVEHEEQIAQEQIPTKALDEERQTLPHQQVLAASDAKPETMAEKNRVDTDRHEVEVANITETSKRATDDAMLEDVAVKTITPHQQAQAIWAKGQDAERLGQRRLALQMYAEALRLDAGLDDARHAQVSLLLAEKRYPEAEAILSQRVTAKPEDIYSVMLYARLLMERNALDHALAVLEASVADAADDPDFLAFLAALYQRDAQHAKAIAYYEAATRGASVQAAWLMGLGISLQALQHDEQAIMAYQKALQMPGLSSDLQGFVQQRLQTLNAKGGR